MHENVADEADELVHDVFATYLGRPSDDGIVSPKPTCSSQPLNGSCKCTVTTGYDSDFNVWVTRCKGDGQCTYVP